MRVSKWGDSLAVRLPDTVVEALDLKEGDEVELRAADGAGLEVVRQPSSEVLLKRLRQFRGRLPEDFAFDRTEANGG